MDPNKLSVHQEMDQPISQYWINSSFKTQGAGSEPIARSFEMALRKGARYIDLEISNGGAVTKPHKPVPLVGGVGLDEVLQTIKKFAFVTSECPLILSLDVTRCDLGNQTLAAGLLTVIFGSSLLTKKVGDPEKLPSPEQLKEKIILNMRVDKEVADEVVETTAEHVIQDVWYFSREEDAEETDPTQRGWKKRDMILKGDSLSFRAQTSEILTEMSKKPYFVGAMSTSNIKAFIGALPAETSRKGSFLMYCNQDHTVFQMVVCVRSKKEKNSPLTFLDCPIHFNDRIKKYHLETTLDNRNTFSSIDQLVKFYQHEENCGGEGNKISHCTTLDEPLQLQGSDIHKYSSWFSGHLDDEMTRNIMAGVTEKGAFLVREPLEYATYGTKFFIEYFDGRSPQRLIVEASLDESEVKIQHTNEIFDTITQVVVHFTANSIRNATKLSEPIQLVADFVEEEPSEGVARNQPGCVSIKRISLDEGVKHVVVDKHDNRHAKDKVEIRTRQAGAQQNHEEEEQLTTTTLDPGLTVEEAELNNQFLRFAHNKKIVIRRSLGDIELTKGDGDVFGIDILLDALRKWTNKAGREVSKEQQKKRTWTMGATSSSSSQLSELAVYCKERRDPLNETQVIHGRVNAKLRQRKQTGLLRMLSRLNCLNYTQITSTDIDRLTQILNKNNIEAFIEFHKNILSKISYRPRRDPKPM